MELGLDDKEAHFAQRSTKVVYFQIKSNEGPILQRVITCSKVQYKKQRAQQDTRDDAKMTCI